MPAQRGAAASPNPLTMRLFALLLQAGWLSDQTARFLRTAVGFRNVLVRGYTAVDLEIVRDVLETRLGDIERFVTEISARLSTE